MWGQCYLVQTVMCRMVQKTHVTISFNKSLIKYYKAKITIKLRKGNASCYEATRNLKQVYRDLCFIIFFLTSAK